MSWGRIYRFGRRTLKAPHRFLHRDDQASIYDAQTVEIMRRVLKRDSNCLDVGAAWGGLLRHMVKIAPEGHHHAFEPLPQFAAVLRADFPQVTVHEVALAEDAGEADFYRVITNPPYSGLKRQDSYPQPDERVDTIRVAKRRLDDLIGADEHLDFVKIDVEGGESGVILGGVGLLRRDLPVVVFEHGPGDPSSDDLLYSCLTDIGLNISTFENWLRSGAPLSRRDFPRQMLGSESWEWMYIAHPVRA